MEKVRDDMEQRKPLVDGAMDQKRTREAIHSDCYRRKQLKKWKSS